MSTPKGAFFADDRFSGWEAVRGHGPPESSALLGLLNGFRMTRLPDPTPSAAAESLLAG
jgi:hypothetical protein